MTRITLIFIALVVGACSRSTMIFDRADMGPEGPADQGSPDLPEIDGGTEPCNDVARCDFEEVAVLVPDTSIAARLGFGEDVALSADGLTLAVGAYQDPATVTGVDCDGSDECAAREADPSQHGSVYVYVRGEDGWIQQAFLRPRFHWEGALFGSSVALSDDGDTLVVGAWSDERAVAGTECDGSPACAGGVLVLAGAVHVFERSDGRWVETAFLKPSNPSGGDAFGTRIQISADGNRLAVAASQEDGSTGGTACDGGACTDDALPDSGAVYVFDRVGTGWTQSAYLKASDPSASDFFGHALSMSPDGRTLVVAAPLEDSSALDRACDGTPSCTDDDRTDSGAYYVFREEAGGWRLAEFVKPLGPDQPHFGGSVLLSAEVGEVFLSSAVGADVREEVTIVSSDDSPRTYLRVSGPVGRWFRNEMAVSRDGRIFAVMQGFVRGEHSLEVFQRTDGEWRHEASIDAVASESVFPGAVAMSGDGRTLALGSVYDMDELGSVRVFELR